MVSVVKVPPRGLLEHTLTYGYKVHFADENYETPPVGGACIQRALRARYTHVFLAVMKLTASVSKYRSHTSQ